MIRLPRRATRTDPRFPSTTRFRAASRSASKTPRTSSPTCARRSARRRRTERGMELTVAGQRVHAGTGGRDFEADLPLVVFIHGAGMRSEEHTSELQSLMRTSYAVFCLKKKNKHQ